MVSQLSREHQVSRQSLYRCKQQAEDALQAALEPRPPPGQADRQLHRLVLTLLLETHASYRQIQTCLQSLHGISLSVSSMCRIVAQAGERARHWLSLQRPSSPRALALEEQSSSKRGEAYLNMVDVHSGQVWASLPPSRSSGRRELDDCVVGLARTGNAG